MSRLKHLRYKTTTWSPELHSGETCEGPFSLTTSDRLQIAKAIPQYPRRRPRTPPKSVLAAIEKVVAPLRKELAAIKAQLKEPVAPEPDGFEKWIRSKDAQKYAGEFVACTGPGKVVAHSKSNDALMDLITDYPDKSELVIDRVPRA